MVSRKNFQQNGRTAMQRMRGAPYKKPFKPQDGNRGGENPQINQIMFTASQMPDNPGYMDFSLNPIPPTSGTNNGPPPPQNATNTNAQQKKRNNKNRQKNKQLQSQQYNQQQMQHQERQQQQQQLAGPQRNGGGNWNKNKNQPGGNNNNRFNRGGNRMPGRNVGFYNGVMPMSGGPINNGGGRRLMPPRNMRGIPPMPPMHGFQSPMIPPIMGRGPPHGMAPPPPFLRRGGPMPPPIPPPMLPPRGGGMHRGGPLPPPMQFNGGGRSKKPNTKIVKKVVKGKSTIKTLKTIANQYPLDKPWVTKAIRAEHETKVDIENRLKGNKDDELFAQFKTQRDKFVALYEAAREEYLKKEAAAVKTKDAKDKQTNNKTATKDANNKEEISKKA